jgi:hypothetical protein
MGLVASTYFAIWGSADYLNVLTLHQYTSLKILHYIVQTIFKITYFVHEHESVVVLFPNKTHDMLPIFAP